MAALLVILQSENGTKPFRNLKCVAVFGITLGNLFGDKLLAGDFHAGHKALDALSY